MNSLSDMTLGAQLPPYAEKAATRIRWRWRQALYAAIVLGDVLGAEMARGEVPSGHDPSILALMHLMAVIKGAMGIAAMLLVDWRFAQPITRAAGLGYCAAVAMMVAAVPPIWYDTHLMAAAAVFHAGLLSFLGLAYADRGVATCMLADINFSRTAR